VSSQFPASPSAADDLLVLLTVSREGRFTSAANSLGVSHTTVARRVGALEKSLGGRVLLAGPDGWKLTPLGERAVTAARDIEAAIAQLRREESGADLAGVIRMWATDGFSGYIAAPAMAALRRKHDRVSLELITSTRQASQHPVGADIQVVVGRPHVQRARAVWLADYALGLYASRELLSRPGTPQRAKDLDGAPLVYFVESLLHVDALDDARRAIPGMVAAMTSTNVFVQVEATRAGAGFGLLPVFLADRDPDLVRVLPDAIEHVLPYFLVARPGTFEVPLIAAFLAELQARIELVRPVLLGTVPPDSPG
jgi:DNA-binding transcriptional LysR family regulator